MSGKNPQNNHWALKMIGEAILLSSINFSIASCEMSSRFSVKNFSKDQDTLQNACDSLVDYMKIGTLWTIGVSLLLYSQFGPWGIAAAIPANLIIMAWIWFSYTAAFRSAAKKHGLQYPKIRFF